GFRRWTKISDQLGLARIRNPHGANKLQTRLEMAERIALLEAATEKRLVFRVNCLERSMALLMLYHRRGIPATLQFGARKQGQLVEAHAWTEVAGRAMNAGEGDLPYFVALDGPISSPETQIR